VVEAVLVIVAGATVLITLSISRRWRAFRRARRFRRARQGETAARALLEARGYTLVDRQATRRARMWVDGRAVEYDVRADYLVVRGGRTFVVEVKTGDHAPDPAGTATRRQLLEYGSVYDADGLILADMSAGKLRSVRFPSPARRAGGTRIIITAALVGLMAGAALTHWVPAALG
jgi:hypothetical protein